MSDDEFYLPSQSDSKRMDLFLVSGRNRYKKYIEPSFVPEPNNVTVHKGQTAVLKCTVENLGPKTVCIPVIHSILEKFVVFWINSKRH